jgi:hypothetical protein
MGILDDAIKEHLELKRRHGAGDDELKQLEDEAFGAAERPGEGSPPDPLAEAPTEFMSQPDAQAAPKAELPDTDEAPGRPMPRSEIADLQEAPPSEPSEPEPPAEEPTEMYDVEEELASSQSEAPSEEELVEEEMDEPRLAPVDPLAGLEEDEIEVEEEEDDDFWDEKRLSDELDQALEAPSEVADEEAEYDEDYVAEVADDEEETPPPAPRQDEDVLEETPDFLEEAPEDDQLWFEQKPPKDFDFDD